MHGSQRIGKRTECKFPAYGPGLELPEEAEEVSFEKKRSSTEVLAEQKAVKLLHLKRASDR